MTRVLQALLGTNQPTFQISLHQLERAGGLPGVDVRLTADILQRTREKIRELGLDPNDTTPEELYHALQERLHRDDTAVKKALGLDETSSNEAVLSIVVSLVMQSTTDKTFALKPSVAKTLLTKQPPKQAMKKLGYRSVLSMLKHEPVAQVMAAAQLSESAEWLQQFRSLYSKLLPSDFESKRLQILSPTSQRWQEIAVSHVAQQRHNAISLPELGTVVLLPISEAHQVQGLALVIILVLLEAVNDIRSSSSYLKFHQVRSDFGETVAAISASRVYAAAKIVGQPVAWQALHHYYAKHLDKYPAYIFEPHLASEDLSWNTPEQVLSELDDTLEFWQDSQYCGLTDDAGNVVSMNLFDATLNYCNNLPFTSRISQYIRQSVWHELTARYLDQQPVEKAITDQLAGSAILDA